MINGIECENNDNKILCGVWEEGSISFLLWEVFKNIIIENEVTLREIMKMKIIEILFRKIILDIIKISLIVLIVGGADILIIIKINHQNEIFGEIEVNPLKDKMLRVWYFM